jgi:hypothetical protein
MSIAFLGFSVIRFASSSAPFAFLFGFAAVLVIIVFMEMCTEITTAFQGIVSIFLAYVIHFAHIRMPYRFIRIENMCLVLFCLAAVIYKAQDQVGGYARAFGGMWFSWVTIVIDELILARHHITRRGFTAIERPADVAWASEKGRAETVRLLTSEEEEAMEANLWSDFLTSVVAFVAIVVGVVVRKFFEPEFFARTS